MITLGVRDMQRSRAFYEALGWHAAPQSEESVTFFQCGGMIVGLFGLDALAEDAGIEAAAGGGNAVALAFNARTKEGVDEVMQEAVAAGAAEVKPPQDTFWGGYAAYFRDPDGHLWEVAWNPFFPIADDGSVSLPG